MNSPIPIQSTPARRAYTPLEVKRMIFISLFKNGAGASKGIPSAALSKLSMYDPNTTMPFATALSLGEDESLQSVVQKAAIEFSEHDELRQNIRYYVKSPKADAEDMRIHVGRLLDEDIKERDLLKKDPHILQRSILAKAILVVNEMEQKWLGIEIQDDAHDFKIQLVTLVNGWGQVTKVELLYFKFKTSFLRFVATLKDETRNCQIPPENITMPTLSWPFADFGDKEVQMNNGTSNTSSDIQNTKSSEQVANGNGISPENIESTQSTSATTNRHPNDKGYSLWDGPWMYRLPHIGKDGESKPSWRCLRDEKDYANMLDGITRVNSKYQAWGQRFKCSVSIMHSLDRDCQQRYFDIREEERAFSAQWEKELEKAGFFDDEDPVGDPGDDWFDSWLRNRKSPSKNT
ncbi:hypothetical protein SBOR_6081 [Sclerotinia borealis F-4128]|uniref:Uncharacterized protein n=1 Tax=Sclerotinia borealis (strain F-4128) TaxID=1432307 RepID=W9CFJ4_SCLBF|nr:hypothetical protein SBOR_6081 [Sclerotinia borealis F-4128]